MSIYNPCGWVAPALVLSFSANGHSQPPNDHHVAGPPSPICHLEPTRELNTERQVIASGQNKLNQLIRMWVPSSADRCFWDIYIHGEIHVVHSLSAAHRSATCPLPAVCPFLLAKIPPTRSSTRS